MPRSPYLGELELMVLLTLVRLDDATHGMAVYDEIVSATGRDISAPTVYITLARLERKKLVRLLAPRPGSEGGRPRKHYALTAAGRAASARSTKMLHALLEPAAGPRSRS